MRSLQIIQNPFGLLFEKLKSINKHWRYDCLKLMPLFSVIVRKMTDLLNRPILPEPVRGLNSRL